MAENDTGVPEGANTPPAEAHYAASRQPATTEAPKVEATPETPTEEPKAEATPEPEAKAEESEADEKPEDAESEEDQKDNEDEPHRPKRRSWKQENIRLTRKNRELREQLAAAASGNQPKAPEQAKEDVKRPKQEDYESYDAYLDARDEFNVKRTRAEVLKEIEQKDSAKRQTAAQDETAKRFNESSEKAKAKYQDYDEAVWELGYSITPEIASLIASAADDPGELAYHLSQNPDVAARLKSLPLEKAALELGKIEARMVPAEAPKPKAIEKPKPPETKAPPPTKTVPTGTAKPVRRLEDLSQSEFYSRRKAEISGR